MLRSSVAMPAAKILLRGAAVSLAAAALLAGCGQKGGLTLPTVPTVPAASLSVDQPAPAPATQAGAASAPVR